jgi:hypothetical protein
MQPVTCHLCSARVLARKSSWEQTSVQWNAASLQQCVRRRQAADGSGGAGATPVFLQGCSDLRDSIETAVRCGALTVLDA